MSRTGALPAASRAEHDASLARWPRVEAVRPAARAGAAAGVRPLRVLCLALTGMIVGNLGRAPVLVRGPEFPVLLNDLFVGAAILVAALACLQARRVRADALVGVAALFAALGTGSGLWAAQKYGIAPGELLGSFAYLSRWLAYFGLYLAVINVARDEDADVLWSTLERMVLAFSLFGVVQVLAFEHFAQTVYPAGPGLLTWDFQGRRLVSTLLDPNFAGILIVFVLLVYAARLSFGVPVRPWKPLLLLGALLLTVSRGAILAFLVGLLIIVAVRGVRRRLVRVAGLIVLCSVPFLPALIGFASSFNKFTIDGSALDRVQSWVRAFTVIADNPLFGVGFNTYLYVQRAYGWAEGPQLATGLDGGLLFVTVLTGVVGLALYLVLLGLVIARCRRLWRDAGAPPDARAVALGTAAATVALVVHSTTVNSLLLPFIMEPHWIMAGVVYLHLRARSRSGALAAAV